MDTQPQFRKTALFLALCCGAPLAAAAETEVAVGGWVDAQYSYTHFNKQSVNGFYDFFWGPEIAVGQTPLAAGDGLAAVADNSDDSRGTGASSTRFHAKNTRLWVTSNTSTDMGNVYTQVSMDFISDPADYVPLSSLGGYENAVYSNYGNIDTVDNSFRPRLRTAYGQWCGWTIGQDYSTFMDHDSMPELADPGPGVGTIYVIQPVVRYTMPVWIGDLSLAVENPDSTIKEFFNNNGTSGADPRFSRDPYARGLVFDERKRAPDLHASYRYDGGWWRGSIRGMGRNLTAGREQDDLVHLNKWTGAVGAGGSMDVPGMGQDRFFVQGHWGNVGRYMGYGVFRDGVLSNYLVNADGGNAAANLPGPAAWIMDGTKISAKYVWGGHMGYTHWWTDDMRSSVVYSRAQAQKNGFEFPDARVNDVNTGAIISLRPTVDHIYESWHANFLWNPIKPLRVGVEYIHGKRKQRDHTFEGTSNRVNISARWDIA